MRYRRHWIVSAAVLVLAGSGGCRVIRHDDLAPVPPAGDASHVVHRAQDDTVILVVNGGDPLHLADADAFALRFRTEGYPHTHVAEWHQSEAIEAAIRGVHRDDPGARIVLIGYSLGAYCVRDLANRLGRDGIPLELVGYVGGDYLSDSPETRLTGITRVVNVTGDGHPLTGRNLFFNGTEVLGARNIRLTGTPHFGLLQHPLTFGVLLDELESVPRPES